MQVVFHDPQLRLLPCPRLRANILLANCDVVARTGSVDGIRLANCDVVARTGWDKFAGTAEWARAAIAALQVFDTIALSIAGHPHPRVAAVPAAGPARRIIFGSTAST